MNKYFNTKWTMHQLIMVKIKMNEVIMVKIKMIKLATSK
jgi:hypothetical protein